MCNVFVDTRRTLIESQENFMHRRHSLFLIVVCWAGVAVLGDWSATVRAADDPENKRIETALDQLTSVDFTDITLTTAAEFIAQLHNIKVEIDHNSLKAIGVDEKSKVSYKTEGMKMKDVLEKMLLSVHVDLTYEIKDGKLRFVAKEKK
jgi:hypothetical protein